MPGVIYTMRDGIWKATGMPDIDPDPDNPDPPTEDPLLWFGVTIFGQSYAQYKEHTIGSSENRWSQGQYDCSYGGNRGGGVTRVFQNPGNPHTWANAKPSYIRDGHCIMYSSLDYYNDETSYKNGFKAWLDQKMADDPDQETRVWYIFKHEFDNDDKPQGQTGPYQIGTPGTGQINRWYDRNIWTREVLELTAYKDMAAKNGGSIRFGMVSTGNPWQHGKNQNSNTAWKSFANGMASYSGAGSGSEAGRNVGEIWDFMGADKYNPAWGGDTRYMAWSDWSKHFALCHDYTGLPIVIGEAGSPRASQTLGQNLTQRNNERAAWLANQFENMKNAGYYDAVCYWRVPANSDHWNAWSTNMVVPTGYNATLGSQYTNSGAANNGGFDDQATNDVQAEYSVRSITEANAFGQGPPLTYYTGGGGFG